MEELEKVLDQYLNNFDSFQNKLNKMIKEQLEKLDEEDFKQKEKAKTEAYLEVFQEAASFEADPDFSSDQIQNALNEAGLTEVSVQEVMLALDQNKTMLGYVVTVVSHEGYSGDITFSVGIKNDSTVNGISILSISETAGLGMKANTEEFKSQFAGVNTSRFEYTKSGASADNQIDAISGATITTNAITNGVNAALEYCNLMILIL